MDQIKIFSAVNISKIDREKGIIPAVSVITEGIAKGHDLIIDQTTVRQVKSCAEQYAHGLQVKVDHGSGFVGIVGVLKKFAIAGKQLRADLHLLKNHDARERILEMASSMPCSFGLSIAFSGIHEERPDGVAVARFARCTEIYSADLVDSPAANPGGLFAARVAEATGRHPEIAQLRADKIQLEAALHRVSQLYGQLKSSFGLSAARCVPVIGPGGDGQGSLIEQYEAMSAGPARTAFFEKHKTALFEHFQGGRK